MSWLGGIDIGGTKCAITLSRPVGDGLEIITKRRFPTPPTPQIALDTFLSGLAEMCAEGSIELSAIGISCGGPLDSRRGLVLSPPHLPGWDAIDVLTPFAERFGVPVALQNDANAGALAEWRWGAGRGFRNVIFLTFGTGMGAGLVLDNRLYAGTNDLAGEVGHMRISEDGPVGYGKVGAFEGICSGSGIAKLAAMRARTALEAGQAPAFCATLAELDAITAEAVGEAAQNGDPLALEVFETVAERLGRGLAVLVDILNPQRILLGSIYGRQRALLEPTALRVLGEEALALSLSVCEVLPAGLGEAIGDHAAAAVALHALTRLEE